MQQESFPLHFQQKGRCLQRHKPEGMIIYFPACSAERELACRSLNSHPFVCHGVYLYIANLHQANLMVQKRGKEGGKNAYENAAAVRGQYSQKKKKKRRPTRSILE